MPTRLTGLTALLVAALLAGCGAAQDSTDDFKGESRDVARAVEDFQDAARQSDEEQICNDLLAKALVARIEAAAKGSKGSCPSHLQDSLRDVDSFELDVKKVTVSGTQATAVVRSEGGSDPRDETLTLVKEGTPAGWRLSSLGG